MGWLSKIFTGVDLEQEQARSDALQAQEVQAGKDYAPGGKIYEKIRMDRGTADADAAWRQNKANIKAGDLGDVTAQVTAEFTDSVKNSPIFQGPLDALKISFSSVPTEYLLAGALGIFFWFGGWRWLRKLF